MWVDSHFHPLYFEQDCIKPALESEIKHLMCVATSIGDFEALSELKLRYPEIYISLGEHPNNDFENIEWEKLEQIALSGKIQAIGECGFDSKADLSKQKVVFQRQLNIAQKANLPIILHSRDCEEITMNSLKNTSVKGVFHCFTGSRALAEFALEIGWYISFSGIITFKNATHLQELLKIVSLEQLLIETDAPYLAPEPMRGKQNKAEYVKYIGEFIAKKLDMDSVKLASQLRQNFINLFGKKNS